MDAFLSDIGWFFFAALIAVLAGLTITAFGSDLLPSKAQIDSAQENRAARPLSRHAD